MLARARIHRFDWNRFTVRCGGNTDCLEGQFVEVLVTVFLGPFLLDNVLKLFGE
jgi:hypothetical protein